jgi:hypothetical protein
MGAKIFICYRRAESFGHARAICNLLRNRFGPETIFMDVDTVDPGDDFAEAIERAIEDCAVVIALIGKEWLTARDDNGRRLDHPDDFVRLELAAALKRKIRVIPALVQGAAMPSSRELPTDLAPLARRNAIPISDPHFDSDVAGLIRALEKVLQNVSPEEPFSAAPAPVATPESTSDLSPLSFLKEWLELRIEQRKPRWRKVQLILALAAALTPLLPVLESKLVPAWAPPSIVSLLSSAFGNSWDYPRLLALAFVPIALALARLGMFLADQIFTTPLTGAQEHIPIFLINTLLFLFGFLGFFGWGLWHAALIFALVGSAVLVPLVDI